MNNSIGFILEMKFFGIFLATFLFLTLSEAFRVKKISNNVVYIPVNSFMSYKGKPHKVYPAGFWSKIFKRNSIIYSNDDEDVDYEAKTYANHVQDENDSSDSVEFYDSFFLKK